MANIYPGQTRTIDPYASYNSNVANRLTRMVTGGNNCLFSTHTIEVELDATSITHVTVSSGQCFKDDVIVQLSESTSLDFESSDSYVEYGGGFNEEGYYYVVLDYEYVKAKPAPQAALKIIKPSQVNTHFTSRYLFLKAVRVTYNGVIFRIASVHDGDPDNPSNQREYTPLYAGVSNSLPTFDSDEHEGMIIYVRDTGALYWGMHGRWEEFQAIRDRVDTYNCSAGQVAYVTNDSTGNAVVVPAIATAIETLGDCVVLEVGYASNGTGQVRLMGSVSSVLVESGITIQPGNRVYLSATEAGKVTNLSPPDYPQYLGRAISSGDSTSPVSMWFLPGGEGTSDDTSGFSGKYDKYQDLLGSSIFLRITYDTFGNLVYVDTANTTANIDVNNKEMDGVAGQTFRSTNLVDSNYDGSAIVSCQVSASITNSSNTTWYVTNDGTDDEAWEPTTVHTVHTFSEIKLPVDSTASYIVGELITGGTSTTTGYVKAIYPGSLLVGDLTGTKQFTVSETVTGSDSGATASVTSSQISRTNCTDLRVRVDFSGSASIEDYGVLYELYEQSTNSFRYSMIADDDLDTKVDCEESVDEDKIRFDAAGTEIMVITGTGVGVKTATPSEALEVNGGIKVGFSGNVTPGTIRWTGSDFQGRDATAWVSLTSGSGGASGLWTEEVGGDIHYNNGNVGINIVGPTERLHVVGKVLATAFTSGSDLQLQVSGTNAITAKDTTRHVGVNTDLPASRLDVSDSTGYPVLTLKRVDSTITDTEVLGQIDFAGTQGVDTASPSYGASIEARATNAWASSVDGELAFYTNSGSGLVERASINENGIVSEAGIKLGPTSTMDAGTLRFMNGSFQGSDGTSWAELGIGQWSDVPNGIIYTGGNVGIGTSTPTEDLDVSSLISTLRLKSSNNDVDNGETYSRIQFAAIDGGSESVPQIGATIRAVGTESWISNQCGSKLEILTCNENSNTLNVRMIVNDDGNVSIGSSDPVIKLDVSGGIRISTTSVEQEGVIRYHNGQFQGYDTTGWTVLSGGEATPSPWTQSGSDLYYTTGNVGIGTTTPDATAQLHVIGNIKAQGTIYADAYSSNSPIVFLVDGAEILRITDEGITGNVGMTVGTVTTPSAGSIQFNGTNFQGYDGTSWTNLDTQSESVTPVWETNGGIITATTVADTMQMTNGSLSNPAYAFSNDPNTGFRLAGSADIGTVINGYEVVNFHYNNVEINNPSAGAASELRFVDSGGEYVGFKPPIDISSNQIWQLPQTDGSNGQALITNGGGVLSFGDATPNPAGSDSQVQYNNGGSMGGNLGFRFRDSGGGVVLSTLTNFTDDQINRLVLDEANNHLRFIMRNGNQSGNDWSEIVLMSDDGGTSPDPTIAQELGRYAFGGYGTSFVYDAAYIQGQSLQTWSGSAQGCEIQFYTTETNSTTPTKRMVIGDSGNIGVGVDSPSETIESNGGIKIGSSVQGSPTAGTIQFDGINFQGHDGTAWTNLDYQPSDPGIGIFTDADTTPSVSGYNVWKNDDSTSVYTITNFDDGVPGKEITIIFSGLSEVTIQNNSNVHLQSGSDFVATLNDTLKLVYDGSAWFETSRSVN